MVCQRYINRALHYETSNLLFLSMFNSPHHKLAKWLVNILEPVKKEFCRFTLKDSFELADQLEDMNVKDKYMFSFDVTSLFT